MACWPSSQVIHLNELMANMSNQMNELMANTSNQTESVYLDKCSGTAAHARIVQN